MSGIVSLDTSSKERTVKREESRLMSVERVRRIKQTLWRNRPDIWLKERMGEDYRTIKWDAMSDKYEGHEWDGDRNPLWQAWLDIMKQQWVSLPSATGTGKTYLASRIAIWFFDVFDNSLIVCAAPTRDQLNDNLWAEITDAAKKLKINKPNLNITKSRISMGSNDDEQSKWQIVKRTAGEGSEKQEKKSTVKAQGFHNENMLFIVDEMTGTPLSLIEAFIQTCVSHNNLILGLGNPDHELDALNQFSQRHRVNSYRVSSYDHPNVVGEENVIKGAVTQISIDSKANDFGEDSDFFKSRVRGICPKQRNNSLFSLQALERCIQEDVPFDDSYPAIGIDPSRSEKGDDASVVYGFNNHLDKIISFKCPRASHIVGNLMLTNFEVEELGLNNYGLDTLEEAQILNDMNIGCDAGNPGYVVAEEFERIGKNITILHGSAKVDQDRLRYNDEGNTVITFFNLRSQMYYELATDIKDIQISINITDEFVLRKIRKQMSAVQFHYRNGKMFVNKKEEIKRMLGGRSPDELDAMVYWNWVRKIKETVSEYKGVFDIERF